MKVGIYGLGRFGEFWAKELAARHDVSVYSRNSRLELSEGIKEVTEDELLECEVLILCVAISAMEAVLGKISSRLRPGQLIMDTCSVKVFPAKWMLTLLPQNVEILGTHPLFGPDSGRNGLQNLPIVLVPLRISSDLVDLWRANFESMGLKVLQMTAEQHDREAAFTQGITHFIGRVLGQLNLQPSEMATFGYNSLTEIVHQTCNDPWTLFMDLQAYNPYTASMRDDLNRIIVSIQKHLDSIAFDK